MGRSVAHFLVPGRRADWALAACREFAMERGFRAIDGAAGVLRMTQGRTWWTGRRVIQVRAEDVAEGASVSVHLWVETLLVPELNANPQEFIGWNSRQSLWNLCLDLLARMGVRRSAEAAFRHG